MQNKCPLGTIRGIYGAIDSNYLPENASEGDKKKIWEKAFASILLNISDKIFRKVSKYTTLKLVFSKLDFLYL